MGKNEKVIFVCTGTGVWQETAKALLEEYCWDPVLYVGFESKDNLPKNHFFANTPYYSLDDARFAIEPQDIPGFEMAPYDIALFAELQNDFDLFMEMMERYITLGHDGSFEQKKGFFIKMLRIWNGILESTGATKVVMASRPHRLFDLVIEMLCKKRGIPALAFEHTNFSHWCFATNLHQGLSFPVDQIKVEKSKISDESAAFLETMRKSYSEGKPVSVTAQGFFSKARQKKEQTLLFRLKKKIPPFLPFLMKSMKAILLAKAGEEYRTLLKFSQKSRFIYDPKPAKALDLLYHRYLREKQIARVRQWYEKNSVTADLNSQYVYFTASFQPERSSCPDSGRYHDLLLALGVVARGLPKSCKIYYKEHPRTFASAVDHDAQRSVLFYERIKKLYPQVELINNKHTPFELIDNSYAVALAGGTTGWEAIVRGKPCFLLGDIWFSGAKSLFLVKDKHDFKNGIQRIESNDLPGPDVLNDYILKLEEASEDLVYIFKSNIGYRSKVQKPSSEAVARSAEEAANDRLYGERAAAQIIRASRY